MPRKSTARGIGTASRVLDLPQTSLLAQTSLLDVLDRVLDKGVMARGEVTLGVAGVDLVYVNLSALLCAADRVLPVKVSVRRKRHLKAGSRG